MLERLAPDEQQALLEGSEPATSATTSIASLGILASVAPVRGRLFVFPHACPHAGCAVVDVPKLIVRGELS